MATLRQIAHDKFTNGTIAQLLADLESYAAELPYESDEASLIRLYLRKAHNFNRRGARRVPKLGYRSDGSAVYRKENEFLIVRPDQYGIEKIVTYGINEE
jgi:hypothetical protein